MRPKPGSAARSTNWREFLLHHSLPAGMHMHPLIIGNRTLTWGERTYVMGILNLTPDSFSGDGLISAASLSDLRPFSTKMEGDIAGGVPGLEQARRFLEA